jgi:hypothetical protein
MWCTTVKTEKIQQKKKWDEREVPQKKERWDALKM